MGTELAGTHRRGHGALSQAGLSRPFSVGQRTEALGSSLSLCRAGAWAGPPCSPQPAHLGVSFLRSAHGCAQGAAFPQPSRH